MLYAQLAHYFIYLIILFYTYVLLSNSIPFPVLPPLSRPSSLLTGMYIHLLVIRLTEQLLFANRTEGGEKLGRVWYLC